MEAGAVRPSGCGGWDAFCARRGREVCLGRGLPRQLALDRAELAGIKVRLEEGEPVEDPTWGPDLCTQVGRLSWEEFLEGLMVGLSI